jgi:hypothetical protein
LASFKRGALLEWRRVDSHIPKQIGEIESVRLAQILAAAHALKMRLAMNSAKVYCLAPFWAPYLRRAVELNVAGRRHENFFYYGS